MAHLSPLPTKKVQLFIGVKYALFQELRGTNIAVRVSPGSKELGTRSGSEV
jgi:hypothetical protein